MLDQFYTYASKAPHQIALVDELFSWTYGELVEQVERTAKAMRRANLTPGDRLLFWDTSKASYMIAFLACIQEHISLVPLHPLAPPAWQTAVAEQLQVAAAAPTLSALQEMVATNLRPGRSCSSDSDVAAIFMTSGTTGVPKGVPIHMEMAAVAAHNTIEVFGLGPESRFLDYIPAFTVGGLLLTGLPQLLAGSTSLMRSFSPYTFADIVIGQSPTHAILLPTMVAVLRHSSSWANLDLSGFSVIGSGASTVPESVAQDLLAHGLQCFVHLYGSTECLTPVMYHRSTTQMAGPHTVFSNLCGDYQARLAADGELLLRGTAILRGYLGASGLNEEAFEEDWFRTGDLFSHSDGIWQITGRKKEILKVGGFSVSPALIEKVILDFQGIRNCAVILKTLRNGGEVLVAIVEGAGVEPRAVLSHCANHLPPTQVPRRVVIVDALPLNAMRKIDRSAAAKMDVVDDLR